METKQCRKCKQTKSLSEFHKNKTKYDGFQSCCKTCIQQYNQGEKAKAADKKYKQSEKCKDTEKSYHQSENGKARDKRFFARHPNQHKAIYTVNNAIHDGKLISPKFLLCHYCPKPAQQYHHWHGYEKEHWLDVVPVCMDCHYKCKRKIA